MDKESLKLLVAHGLSVERIARRFGKHPSTVSYWMAKHGLDAPGRARHAAKGGIEREELEQLIEAGSSIAEIATHLQLSKTSVRHWLKRYGLRTRAAVQAATSATSRAAGRQSILRICPIHGQSEFALEGRGYYRCKRCRSDRITQHRRRLKLQLVAEAGGSCRLCGYDRCIAALEFHHLEPVNKRHAISGRGMTLSMQAVRAEAAKCVLICSNCHAEIENGVTALPVKC
jgi:transposase